MIVSEATKQTAQLHEDRLFALPNVNGVGHGKKIVAGEQTDRDAVMVFVKKKVRIEPNFLKRVFLQRLHPNDAVPPVLEEGIETDVVYADEIFGPRPVPISDGPDPTERHRPASGGVSIGHYKITAGTLAYWFRHKVTGRLVALTNNHVGANSNDADRGDRWEQPGPHDGGTEADKLCELADFVPIVFTSIPCPIANAVCRILNGLAGLLGRKTRLRTQGTQQATNTVDCAIGFPVNEADVKMEILGIGKIVHEVVEATIEMEVQKFGRTTLHTLGKVISLDTTVSVNYGGPIAIFEHQIVIGPADPDKPFSAGGDSGSLVLDMLKRVVGLLFGGSTEVTIINEIKRVFDEQGIEFA